MDIVGPLIRTPRGHNHILVITDRFSKLTVAVPMKRDKTTSWDIAKALGNHWVMVYGVPETVLTDNAQNVTSKFLMLVYKLLGVKPNRTTAYHPQTNGQTERYNRTLIEAIRKLRSSVGLGPVHGHVNVRVQQPRPLYDWSETLRLGPQSFTAFARYRKGRGAGGNEAERSSSKMAPDDGNQVHSSQG